MTPKIALVADTASDLLQFEELRSAFDIPVIYMYINILKDQVFIEIKKKVVEDPFCIEIDKNRIN